MIFSMKFFTSTQEVFICLHFHIQCINVPFKPHFIRMSGMFLLYLFNFTGVVYIRISHLKCLLPLLLLISLSFCSSFLFSSPPARPSSLLLLLGPVPHLLLLSRMLSLVLFWFCSFGLLRLSSSMVHGDIPLDDSAGTGRRVGSSYLSEGGESSRRHTALTSPVNGP